MAEKRLCKDAILLGNSYILLPKGKERGIF